MQVWTNDGPVPYQGAPLALEIRTFARRKNDYTWGPFFTDSDGVLSIGRRELDLAAAGHRSAGFMDYAELEDSFALVEIIHYSVADIARIIQAREARWTMLLDGEEELYGSLPALCERLRTSGNHRLAPPTEYYGRLRDEWTDPTRHAEYTYFVVPAQSA